MFHFHIGSEWACLLQIYMLFAVLGSVRIVKNCDRGLENAARGRRPRAAFSSPRSQFFTIRTDPKPANNLFIFFPAINWPTFGFTQLFYWIDLRAVIAPNLTSEGASSPDTRQRNLY